MTIDTRRPILSDLPDYYEWNQKEPIDFVSYAAIKLTPDLAITVTKLFWPDFTVYENRVFLSFKCKSDTFDTFEQAFKSWKQALNGDFQAVEKMINHIHLAQDLLIYPFENLSYDTIAYFGDILVKIWRCALATEFPERRFEVSGEKDGDFDDFMITFWQSDR